MSKTVNIKPLKDFAFSKMPKSALREVLLMESDTLDIATFLARLPVWLQLAKLFCEAAVSHKAYYAKPLFRRIFLISWRSVF